MTDPGDADSRTMNTRLTDYYASVARDRTFNYQESGGIADSLLHRPSERHRRRCLAKAFTGVKEFADVGCGFGYYLPPDLSQVERVYLNDIVPEMADSLAAELRQRYPQLSIESASYDLMDMPTETMGTWDLVMCLGVLNHFDADGLVTALDNLQRVTARRLILYYAHDGFILSRLVGGFFRQQDIYFQLHRRADVARILAGKGLQLTAASYAFKLGALSPLVFEEYRRA